MNLPSLDYFQTLKLADKDGNPIQGADNLGTYLHETFSSVQKQTTQVEQQTNANALAQPEPPTAVQSLQVTGQNGHFHFAIRDQNPGLKRGVQYRVEYADNSSFVNPQHINLGDARNGSIFLGNGTYYWRAQSSYPSSQPGPLVYHGSAAQPMPVQGGGDVGGPAFLASQGTGTGAPGQGGQGPGPVPVRESRVGYDWSAQGPSGSGLTPVTGTPAGFAALSPGPPQPPGIPSRVAIRDTRANRSLYPPAQYANGAVYQESDTHWEYITAGPASPNTWIYQSGVFLSSNSSAPPSDVPTGLGVNDAGAQYKNSYWGRSWIWNGSGWDYFGGGEIPGTHAAFFTAPIYGQWGISDGSNYIGVGPALNSIVVNSLPFYTTGTEPIFIAGGPVASGVAKAPKWDPAAVTDDESAHTHTVAGELTVAGFVTGTDFVDTQTTSTGTPHHHILSDANAKILPPGIANGGLPLHSVSLWYVRL